MARKKTKEIDPNDIINKSILVLVDIMEDQDEVTKLRLDAASKLLSVLAKNKRFEEANSGPKQLTLDLALTMRKEIYGLEN